MPHVAEFVLDGKEVSQARLQPNDFARPYPLAVPLLSQMDQRARDGKNPYEGAMYTREVGKLEEDQSKTCFPPALQRRSDIKKLVAMEKQRTSFTYIIIGGLKRHVVEQLKKPGQLKSLCEHWARTYYYYLDYEGAR